MLINREKCPVCGHNGIVFGRESKGGKWNRCLACESLFDPTIEREWYVQECLDRNMILPDRAFNTQEPKIKRCLTNDYAPYSPEGWRDRLHLAEIFANNHQRVIEIGFGGCDILKYIREENKWKESIGIEVYADYVLFGKHLGFDVHYGEITNQDVIPSYNNSCDLVILNEVMEHVEEPTVFLKKAGRYIKPFEGILWASFACAKDRNEIDVGEWNWWEEKTIKTIASICGFEIVNYKYFAQAYLVSMKKCAE